MKETTPMAMPMIVVFIIIIAIGIVLGLAVRDCTYYQSTDCARSAPEECIQSTLRFNSSGCFCEQENERVLYWKWAETTGG